MGKRETKQSYQDTRTDVGRARSDYGSAIGASDIRSGELQTGLPDQRSAIAGGYQNLMGEGGRINAPTVSTRNINVGELRDALGGYKGFRDTGGLSGENVQRMRGLGGFDEFAQTGGYSPEAIANIKAQALSPIGSYATGTRDELARRRSLQGGYAPGFDSANRQLQRDAARAIADTSLNANVAIQDRINEGRRWGIGGIAGSEAGLAGMQTGNRLAALGGESNIGNMLSGYDANNVANELRAAEFNAAMQDSANRYNQGQYATGLSGLAGLYGSDIDRLEAERNRQQALLNSQYGAIQGSRGQQSQLGMQPGIGGNIAGAIGAGAGIASQLPWFQVRR